MIYLQTNSVLAEIKQIQFENKEGIQKLYLIGDEVFYNLPSSIVLNSFVSANWNRSLKYTSTIDVNKEVVKLLKNEMKENFVIDEKIGYHKISFDLYLNTVGMKLEILTKSNFDNMIVSQKPFKEEFLLKIIDSYNKFKTDNKILIPRKTLVDNIINFTKTKLKDINNFIVNDSFDITNKKFKWKKLVVLSNKTEIEYTKFGQIIYYINKKKIDLDIINYFKYMDIKSNTFYVEGYVVAQKDLFLNINYEDVIEGELIKGYIYSQINNMDLKPEEKEFHLYNVTLDEKHLINVVNYFNELSYDELKEQLDVIFAKLNNNYYSEMYSSNVIKQLLFERIKTKEDLIDWEKNVKRFGIITKNDQALIESIKK